MVQMVPFLKYLFHQKLNPNLHGPISPLRLFLSLVLAFSKPLPGLLECSWFWLEAKTGAMKILPGLLGFFGIWFGFWIQYLKNWSGHVLFLNDQFWGQSGAIKNSFRPVWKFCPCILNPSSNYWGFIWPLAVFLQGHPMTFAKPIQVLLRIWWFSLKAETGARKIRIGRFGILEVLVWIPIQSIKNPSRPFGFLRIHFANQSGTFQNWFSLFGVFNGLLKTF